MAGRVSPYAIHPNQGIIKGDVCVQFGIEINLAWTVLIPGRGQMNGIHRGQLRHPEPPIVDDVYCRWKSWDQQSKRMTVPLDQQPIAVGVVLEVTIEI